MPQRRMFSLQIVDTDAFLEMPISSQLLYFHLAMRADDEGFVGSPKKVMKLISVGDDDIKVLLSKRFILTFESGIIVIKHWLIHNSIRMDRLNPTSYQREKKTLKISENKSYTEACQPENLKEININNIAKIEKKENSIYIEKRKKAIDESSLPDSFSYKIRQYFIGKVCPVCKNIMRDLPIDELDYNSRLNSLPTIQHNIPISKGGKHELGNISVICHHCNVSLRDKETDKLNSDEVIKAWLSIDGQMSVKCPLKLSKVNLSKVNLIREKNFKIPSLEEVKNYCTLRANNINPEQFINFYEARGWMIGKNKMKNWQAAIRTWEGNKQNNSRNIVNL